MYPKLLGVDKHLMYLILLLVFSLFSCLGSYGKSWKSGADFWKSLILDFFCLAQVVKMKCDMKFFLIKPCLDEKVECSKLMMRHHLPFTPSHASFFYHQKCDKVLHDKKYLSLCSSSFTYTSPELSKQILSKRFFYKKKPIFSWTLKNSPSFCIFT